jgi:hypothetical protein
VNGLRRSCLRSGEDCPIFGSSAAIGSQARDWEPRTGKGRNLSPPRLPLLQRPSSAWFLQARLTSWFRQTRPAALIALSPRRRTDGDRALDLLCRRSLEVVPCRPAGAIAGVVIESDVGG